MGEMILAIVCFIIGKTRRAYYWNVLIYAGVIVMKFFIVIKML